MKIGILTGGGDCPGLNPVIRAVVRKAMTNNDQVLRLTLWMERVNRERDYLPRYKFSIGNSPQRRHHLRYISH